MGLRISNMMSENFEKQQKFMQANQLTVMERQITMQNQMREKMMAMQIARARDLFQYFAAFYCVTLPLCLFGGLRHRKPGAIAPLLPLTFILAYLGDAAYYTKIHRMRDEAQRIIADEYSLLEMPFGMPTIETIEEARLAKKK